MPKTKVKQIRYRRDPSSVYERYMMLKAEMDGETPVSTNPRIKTWWDFTCKNKRKRKK